jgi:predicted peroxiredoxin
MDMRRLKTAEMKYMTCTAGYSLLDNRRNEDILEKCEVHPAKK